MRPKSDRISASLRQTICDRAQNCCEYCGCPAEYLPDSFTIDHIQPHQSGGLSTLENLAWACNGCNGYKHTRTLYIDPETEEEVMLFNPRKENWDNHFTWISNYRQIIGRSPTGRATIDALKLNRSGLMNLRRLLSNSQLYPPNYKPRSP